MPTKPKVINTQIAASVGESKIDVSVGGGVGPTGSQGPPGDTSGFVQEAPMGFGTAYVRADGNWVDIFDSLSNSREWTASTITQAEAEGGVATVRRAFTAQRVFQAIAAWWASTTVTNAKIAANTIGLDKLQNISGDTLLGRPGVSAGAVQTIACTSAGRAFLSQESSVDQRAVIGAAASTHTHGNITNDGKIGTTNGLVVVTGVDGVVTTAGAIHPIATSGSYGDLENIPSTFAPSAHKSSHATGGSDALTPADIGLGTEGLSFSYTGPAAADLLPLNDTSQVVPYRFALPDGTALYSGGRTAGPGDLWPPLNVNDLGSGRITSLSTNATSTPGGILTQVSFQTVPNLVSFSAPDLVMSGSIGASAALFVNLTTLSFPELVLAKGSILGTFSVLTALSFPKLRFASSLSITANAATTVSFPVLESATGNVAGQYNAVTSISFPELRTCGGIGVSSTSLTTLAIPKLRTMSGSFSPVTPLLATLTLPPLGQWKVLLSSLSLTSGSLPQGSVDALLAHLAYMDGNNDTLAYGSSRVVQITGSNAAPSNLGSVTVTLATSPTLPNLVCSGTTCTVNMTAHGYAVGDVLRVSGVTGATNANRYAVVATVPNANQFTYTTVNTASPTNGAGQMNIVKASNNVKTLVTRGVSLTTM